MSPHLFQEQNLATAWHALQSALPVKLHSIRSEKHYEQLVAFLNELLDVVGDNEEHELADFLDLVGQLIEKYERVRPDIGTSSPRATLRFLMDEHRLSQADLSVEVGGQSIVSDILNGKRSINARQATSLAARFAVSPTVFLQSSE